MCALSPPPTGTCAGPSGRGSSGKTSITASTSAKSGCRPSGKDASDIPKLALYVLDRLNARLKRPKRLTPAALSRLQGHAWPGNVRDLENTLERSARLTTKDLLDADDLQIAEPLSAADPLVSLPEPRADFSLEDYLRQTRRRLLLRALELSHGNQTAAARLLGISPQAVHKFLQGEKDEFNPS